VRRLLLVIGGFLLLLVLLAGGALEALKTQAVRDRIAAELSSALGQPVTIGELSVSLLPSPALTARAVRIGRSDPGGAADSTAAPGLFVREIRVVPRLASLLPGRPLAVDRVDLTGMVIAVRRDRAGHWELPVVPVAGADTSTAHGPAFALDTLRLRDGAIRIVDDRLRSQGGPAATTISRVTAAMHASAGRVRIPRLSGYLGKTSVVGAMQMGPTGAEILLRIPSVEAADLPALFALAGMEPYPGLSIAGKAPVSMTIRTTPDFASHTATGEASIDKAQLDALSLENLRTTFRLDEKGLFTLDPLTFTAYGGHERGAVTVDLSRPVAAYTIRTSLQGLDVQRALAATTTMKDLLSGTAQADAALRGSGHTAAAVQQSLTGTVRFAIADGVIRHFPVLAAINEAAGITAGSDSDVSFQRLGGIAKVGGGQAHVDSLALRAGELAIAGAGVIGFDKRLNLHLVVQLSPEKTAELARTVGLGKLTAPGGRLAIPVTVTGTTTAPSFGVDLGAVAKQQVPEELKKLLPTQLQQGLEQVLPGKR
jgi:uncharacterized protein involved in outer membrane biogenesis